MLYSVPDLPGDVTPDLSSVRVTVHGDKVESQAEIAADAAVKSTVRRTSILAIDVSKSMRGERFVQAKLAAEAFLAGVSPDVYVGIVAFAGDVATVQEPSRNRADSAKVLDELTLSLETRLYDGVLEAVSAAGTEGQRNVLVLSDGRDTSETPLDDVTATVERAGVKVDVVALAQGAKGLAPLKAIADAGQGSVLSADDPAALTQVFLDQADVLAQQVFVTAQLPAGLSAREGTVSVSLDAGNETYTGTAFVALTDGQAEEAAASSPQAPPPRSFTVSKNVMLGGLAAAGVGILLLLISAFGVFGEKRQTVEDRIAAYSRQEGTAGSGTPTSHSSALAQPHGLAGSAVGMAEKALESNKGLAASVGERLEAAGMSLKPAEWLLLHAGVAVGTGMVGFLLSSGGGLVMLLFLIIGAIVPWMYLGLKRSRRVSAFNNQLADTLQLVSGGLSAGLSLAQSVDTVVRQGSEPMTTEFKRALVEARLGVSIEDALDSIAERMQSKDFKWVVVAVRIQREVGGNLSEVLGQVAATIRERAYLQRQVKSLSAEGKMSAWILGALPVVVFLFLMMTNGAYFEPMFTTGFGWTLLGLAVVLMSLAVLWMRKLIRMEV
jgi:tight adherence protein B